MDEFLDEKINLFSSINEKDMNGLSALEKLLSYTVSEEEAKRQTAQLIRACGSVSSVFDAPYTILTEQGLSMNQAVLIKLIPAITRKYLDSKYYSSDSATMIRDIKHKIIASFIGTTSEQVLLVLRDKFDTELYFGVISKGSVNASEIYIKKIIELARRYKAASAEIAHNHPSGISFPSEKDAESTLRIKNALHNINVDLTNHYIVAANKIFSMAESEDFFDLFL